jgi:outer membrane protein TolC
LALAVVLTFFAAGSDALGQAADSVSLTLEEALARAGRQSEFFARGQAQAGLVATREDATCSALWPRLVASLDVVRNDEEVSLGTSSVVNLVETSGRIALTADLFRGGTIPRCQAAGLTAEAAQESRVVNERNQLLLIAQAYFAVMAAERQRGVAQSAQALRLELLDAAQALLEAERGLSSDVSRAELELARAEQALVDSERSLADASDALALLLGDSPGTPYVLSTPTLPPLAVETRSVEAAAGIEAAELRERAAYWELIPSVTLSGVANFAASSFRDPDGFNWAITLGLSWVIFDGGGRYAEMDATELDITLSELSRDETNRRLAFAEALAERRVESAQQAHELAVRSETLAHQTFEEIMLLLQSGRSNGLERSQALNEWVTAQIAVTVRELELDLATLEAAYHSGELWPEGLSSVNP